MVIELESQINIREPPKEKLKEFKEQMEKEIFEKTKLIFGEPFNDGDEYLKINTRIKTNKLIKEKEEK